MKILSVLALFLVSGSPNPDKPSVVLAKDVRLELNTRFTVDNQGWRFNATKESLGCLVGYWQGNKAYITGWSLATKMRRLHGEVGGECPSGTFGSWHDHPWDCEDDSSTAYGCGSPIKYRVLSMADLFEFKRDSTLNVALVSWDVDSIDAAAKAFILMYPVPVE